MKARFTQSFKIQAVEKALERANDDSLKDIADDLKIRQSTLVKWIRFALINESNSLNKFNRYSS
ncbi:MAG TPA: hypothetical protein EYO51_08890 [Methylococcaceae bacterium]|nr:hypothetical protein [Methylococcaceae bacterium]HIB63227.1 hypothetical protein [Methylococcaceae bacterium]HIO44155.1 hypothetical protein [Methylococcales bacterium]